MGQSDNHGADWGHPHPAQPATFLLQVSLSTVREAADSVCVECYPDIMSALFWRRRSSGHIFCPHLARGDFKLFSCVYSFDRNMFCNRSVQIPFLLNPNLDRKLPNG